MHEMALAEGVLAVVLDAAGDEVVRSVDLGVGALQLVVPESLKFSFDLASEGTPAEGAAIYIREIPARLRCKPCRAETIIQRPPFQCDRCASSDVEVVTGDELVVDAIELESGQVVRRREVPTEELLAEHIREHHAASS